MNLVYSFFYQSGGPQEPDTGTLASSILCNLLKAAADLFWRF
jgi:hypothetical protein